MGSPVAVCLVIATGCAAEAWVCGSAVVAEWCSAMSAVAAGADGPLPRANAAARPAMAAGAAAIGSRRLTVVLVELDEPPKGLPPAKIALTGKAAPAVHWRCTRAGRLRSA